MFTGVLNQLMTDHVESALNRCSTSIYCTGFVKHTQFIRHFIPVMKLVSAIPPLRVSLLSPPPPPPPFCGRYVDAVDHAMAAYSLNRDLVSLNAQAGVNMAAIRQLLAYMAKVRSRAQDTVCLYSAGILSWNLH